MAVIVCDTEVYRNYFLAAFKNVSNGKTVTVELRPDGELDRQKLANIMAAHTIVTFNGNHFDLPILAAALSGASCARIKYIADTIIQTNMRPWIAEKTFNLIIPKKWDHIDLMEVAPKTMISLKIYNGRLHGKRMQDLPFPEDATLADDEIGIVRDYCINDLDSTILLYTACGELLDLRRAITKEYGVDVRSKSDAQVAEAMIKAKLEKKLGHRVEKPDYDPEFTFRYQVPDYLQFDHPELAEIVEKLRHHDFTLNYKNETEMPDFLEKRIIRINETEYKLGLGGLHSQDHNQAFVSDETHVLIDSDVASYYPRIILNQRLYPRHLGRAFLEIYEGIVNDRLADKAKMKVVGKELDALIKDMTINISKEVVDFRILNKKTLSNKLISLKTSVEGKKISINGIFGKLGNQYSIVFAPDLMIQTTVSGQLTLLLLVEHLEKVGFKVVSANTDGIVVYCERARQWVMDYIIHEWENLTRFEMESTVYLGLYSRDINNYIAIKANGKAKGKGAFNNPCEDFDNPDYRGMMEISPENLICIEAVVARITKKTPLRETIMACKDIRKFISIRTVRGGAIYDREYLGKAVRWYYGHTSVGCIEYKSNGHKVPRTDGAVPLMELPDVFPSDVNYDVYEVIAARLLEDLGIGTPVTNKSLLPTLFSKLKRKALYHAKRNLFDQ